MMDKRHKLAVLPATEKFQILCIPPSQKYWKRPSVG